MSASTTRLGLTKPGGGSTGLITPADIVDIDVLNANFDKIDSSIGYTICTSATHPNSPFVGQQIYETDTKLIATWVGGVWVYPDGIPLGSIQAFVGAAAPNAKWLLAQGQAISRSAYPDFFAQVGTTFGAGDGATTFNIPDLRGQMLIGAGVGTATRTFANTDVVVATDIITVPDTAPLPTGTAVVLSGTGAAPTGLAFATTYYVIKLSATTIKLASSLLNAQVGQGIDITAQGTGINTLTVTNPAVTLGQRLGAWMHLHSASNDGLVALIYAGVTRIAALARGWTATNSNNYSIPGGAGTGQTTGASVQGATDQETSLPPAVGVNYLIKVIP